MAHELGLRERKKLRTQEAIANVALAMFLENGFANVPIAEIAAAADVSKMTVFNYFPAKEDLVMYHLTDHDEEEARIVRERDPRLAPLEALRARYLTALERRAPFTGLSDDAAFIAFHRMIAETPSLLLRMGWQGTSQERSLAAAFAEVAGCPEDDIVVVVAASQVISTQHALFSKNSERMFAGRSADDVAPVAVAEAGQAFDLLAGGLSTHGLSAGPAAGA